jgi:hypothetical protein
MAQKKQIPSLKNWGGVRSIQNKLKRSNTLVHNREAVAYSLLSMANTKITDVMSWDDEGKVTVKASGKIPDHALQSIKNVKVRRLQSIKNVKVRRDKDGNETMEFEFFDKVQVLRLLAKASGLLDNPENENKPSVIGINVKAPEVIDNESD